MYMAINHQETILKYARRCVRLRLRVLHSNMLVINVTGERIITLRVLIQSVDQFATASNTI